MRAHRTRAGTSLRRWGYVGALVIGAAGYLGWQGWMGAEPASAGAPPTARLISGQQYVNAVQDLFGEDLQVEADFAAPQRRHGLLSLGASDVVMTPGLLDQFDRAARGVAAQIVDEGRRDLLVPCRPRDEKAADDACAGAFFAHVGRLLYRRPLLEDERLLHVTLAREASKTFGDFWAGLAHSLAAMLVSPEFIYFVETVEPDPARQGHHRLDAWSKATRLSLFLWNSLPDAMLLEAAESGRLHEPEELERQVARMIATPDRLERGVRAFFDDLLQFDNFATLTKDPLIYPSFTPQVSLSAQEQALRMIVDHLLTLRGDYRELFTTSRSFVDEALAPLHRVPGSGGGWAPVALDQRTAAGLLTSFGFLAVHSHPGRSSPTLRGKAIREALLCQKVPEPPANVNFANFEASLKTVKTARERLNLHSSDAVCAGCHKITDPIGLALENFDGAGQFRETENEAPIDVSGTFDRQAFEDVPSFGQALSAHPSLAPCLVSRLYAHAIGRNASAGDRQWLAYMGERFASEGYRYPELLRDIATSRAFYAVTMPNPQQLASN